MKSDKLIDAMNEIDDEYILEAHESNQPSIIKRYWKPVAATALCACVALLIIPQVLLNFNNKSSDYGEYAMSTKEYAYDDEDLYMAEEEISEEKKEVSNSNSNTKLIVTSSIEMETLDLDEVMKNIDEQTKASNGYTQYSNLYTTYSNQRVYSATIRIPAQDFDAYVESIKGLANVTSYSQSIDDVTDSYYDVQSHIDSLEAEKERVTEFYEKAQTVDELTTVEQRLSEIEYELNYYQSQKKNYDTLTNYSTLNINVKETKVYTETKDDFGSRLGNAFSSGLLGFIEGIQLIILALVYNIWSILALIILVFIVVKVYRWWKNRK